MPPKYPDLRIRIFQYNLSIREATASLAKDGYGVVIVYGPPNIFILLKTNNLSSPWSWN